MNGRIGAARQLLSSRHVRAIAILLLGAAVAPSHAQPTAEVRGSVADARGGEALSNVAILLAGGAFVKNR